MALVLNPPSLSWAQPGPEERELHPLRPPGCRAGALIAVEKRGEGGFVQGEMERCSSSPGGIPSARLWSCSWHQQQQSPAWGAPEFGGTETVALLSPLMGPKGWVWDPQLPFGCSGCGCRAQEHPDKLLTNPIRKGCERCAAASTLPQSLKYWRALAFLTPDLIFFNYT